MSILQDLEEYLAAVDPVRRAEVESIVRQLLIYEEDVTLPPDVEAEITRRLNDKNRKTIPYEDVMAEFGRSRGGR